MEFQGERPYVKVGLLTRKDLRSGIAGHLKNMCRLCVDYIICSNFTEFRLRKDITGFHLKKNSRSFSVHMGKHKAIITSLFTPLYGVSPVTIKGKIPSAWFADLEVTLIFAPIYSTVEGFSIPYVVQLSIVGRIKHSRTNMSTQGERLVCILSAERDPWETY